MTKDHERFSDRWRRARGSTGVDNKLIGSRAEAVVQARSIQHVSIGAPPGGGSRRPRQLPRDVMFFTDRADELAKLDVLLADRAGDAGGSSEVVISVIAGAGGMGKTSLAVHWAHRVRDRFPDGQLYVNLRGYGPSSPLTPAQALEQFLRALGTADEAIPSDVEAMASSYRSLLADRWMLIVLDNATTAEQVRPLLPNTPTCLVIVTSRSRLSGLVARDGAHRVNLDQLPPAEAVTLLQHIIGAARADTEPQVIRELAHRCAGLPLALRIAAERVADRPHRSLTDLVADLADEQNRMDMLAADDDDTTAVRTVFSWSYRALPVDTARVFRLLGLHPGPTISAPAAAALIDATTKQALRHLDELTAVHLLTEIGRDRYQFHDLVRDYAAEQTKIHESERDRTTILRRSLSWYLHTAYAAQRLVYPHGIEPPPDPPEVDCRPLTFDSRNDAVRWCDQEYPNLTAAVQSAAEHGHHDLAAQLPLSFVNFMDMRARWADVHTMCSTGIASARQPRDTRRELWLSSWAGDSRLFTARFHEAISYYRHTLELARVSADRLGEGGALHLLGMTLNKLHRLDEAADHCERALTVFQQIGNQRGESHTLIELGDILRQQQRFEEALHRLRQALVAAQRTSNQLAEALSRRGLGSVYSDAGQFDNAVEQFRGSIAISRDRDDHFNTARTLQDLGDALSDAGRVDEAHESWREALAIFEVVNAPQATELRARLGSPPPGGSRSR